MARSSNPVFNSEAFKQQVKAGRAANAFPTPSAQSLESMYSTQAPGYATPGYGQQAPGQQQQQPYGAPQERMTVADVLNKMIIMVAGLLVGGAIGWFSLVRMASSGAALGPLIGLAVGASIAALVIGIVNQVKRVTSPALSIVYALLEGFLLGVFSSLFELIYPGIVIQAVLGTGIVFLVCLGLNRSGKFRTTPKMRRVMSIAGFAFVGFALVNWILAMVTGGAFNLRTGWIGLLVGVIGICIGAFYLVTDFEDIEAATKAGAPKNFAWRCAFGLTLSLVWIYVEMLRVLAIIREMTN